MSVGTPVRVLGNSLLGPVMGTQGSWDHRNIKPWGGTEGGALTSAGWHWLAQGRADGDGLMLVVQWVRWVMTQDIRLAVSSGLDPWYRRIGAASVTVETLAVLRLVLSAASMAELD